MATAGGGHGTPIPTLISYPVFFLFDIFKSGGGLILWAVLLGQFPFYGFLIDVAKRKSTQLTTLGIIVVVHVGLILITATDADFWELWN